MKIYRIEAEEKNPIPWGINKNHIINIKDICEERFHQLPKRALVEIEKRDGLFFPPVISDPFFLVARDYVELISMYEPTIRFHYVKLICKDSQENATYFIPLLPETDCLTKECIGKPVLKEIIVKAEAVRDYAIQRIKGYYKPYVLIRMDLAESILQRGALGIRLTEVRVV